MKLSSRFALVLIVLLLVTLGFVVRSIGPGVQVDPCRDPEGLKRMDFVTDPDSVQQPERWITPLRRQWTAAWTGEGGLSDPRLRLRIVREFSVFALWVHPSLVIRENFVPDVSQVEWIETEAGSLPVHFEYKYSGSRARLVAYAYVYGMEPVANPAAAAVLNSWRAALFGTPPLTLFLASGYIEHGNVPALRAGAARWLSNAFEHFQNVCGP